MSDVQRGNMDWPNDESWCALDEREVGVLDCGKLIVPTGRLLACDPFCYLGSDDFTLGSRVRIPPGEYPVKISHEAREVHYASLILSDAREVTRRHLLDMPEAVIPESADKDHLWGFPVEAGVACFVDEGAINTGMPPDRSLWGRQVIYDDLDTRIQRLRRESELPSYGRQFGEILTQEKVETYRKAHEEYESRLRAEAMREPPDEEALAYLPAEEHWIKLLTKDREAPFFNTRLPLANDGANIIVISSFGGDGSFPLVGGYDAGGNLVAIHIDFWGPAEGQEEDESS